MCYIDICATVLVKLYLNTRTLLYNDVSKVNTPAKVHHYVVSKAM